MHKTIFMDRPKTSFNADVDRVFQELTENLKGFFDEKFADFAAPHCGARRITVSLVISRKCTQDRSKPQILISSTPILKTQIWSRNSVN